MGLGVHHVGMFDVIDRMDHMPRLAESLLG